MRRVGASWATPFPRFRVGYALLFAIGAICLAGSGCESTDPVAGPRAIVLISVDTLRADHLGLYGHPRFTSPILDEFGSEGVVFTDVSAPAPWTLPSHASMLTGLFPRRHGVVTSSTGLAEGIGTLAGWLAAAGWDTAAIINVIWLKRETYGLTRDFQEYLSIQNPDYSRREPSTWITDQAITWLREQAERPLFLFVHYYDVHADYASLPEYERLLVSPYEGKADGSGWQMERANFNDAHISLCLRDFSALNCQFGSAELKRRIDESMQRVRFDAEDIRHLEELYDAGIRQLDSELGRLFRFLDESGRSEDTLVVVTSDHGEEFMEHGRLTHFLSTYEESLRVPLILRGPGLPSGTRIEKPASLVDLAPTLLGMAGVSTPEALDGLDLSPLWKSSDRSDSWPERAIFGEGSGGIQYSRNMPGVYPIFRSVREGNFKLVEILNESGSGYALYDLAADPGETVDRAADQPLRTARLKRVLEARYRDPHVAPPRAPAVELDPSEIDELRALGYVP